uniref:Uncharacterized protein n=1 Tax=Nothoprocta perdicaria TaxID=30464 RepID=A0A8C7A3J2_NOTPE
FSSWPPATRPLSAGHLLFSLLGHQDVVRDLSFAPNGSLILVSASRDKTLRVWDLSRDGRSLSQVQVTHFGAGEGI